MLLFHVKQISQMIELFFELSYLEFVDDAARLSAVVGEGRGEVEQEGK